MASPSYAVGNPQLGHYQTSHRAVLLATQAANSRLFEIANLTANKLLVVSRIRVELIQTAAHTAAILDTIDAYKCTGFSVVDTTETVTPVAVPMSTGDIASGAVIRGVTVAGAAAGMTGGTLTKIATPFFRRGIWLLAAVPTTPNSNVLAFEWAPDASRGEMPMVCKQNEGFIIENGVLLGAAAGSAISFECSFGYGD